MGTTRINYEKMIINLLQGETPKEKYKYLQELLTESIAEKINPRKQIIISPGEGMKTKGLYPYEVVGLLRSYENIILSKQINEQSKPTNNGN